MPNTARGYPYPLGSDDADVPADLQALAQAVNDNVDTHEAAKTGVHGIPSMTSGHGLLWNGTAWVSTDLATQTELDAATAERLALPTISHPSLAVDTARQPNASRPVLVTVSIHLASGAAAYLRIANANPPTDICAEVTGGGHRDVLVGMVPAGWRYRVNGDNASITMQTITEYTL